MPDDVADILAQKLPRGNASRGVGDHFGRSGRQPGSIETLTVSLILTLGGAVSG